MNISLWITQKLTKLTENYEFQQKSKQEQTNKLSTNIMQKGVFACINVKCRQQLSLNVTFCSLHSFHLIFKHLVLHGFPLFLVIWLFFVIGGCPSSNSTPEAHWRAINTATPAHQFLRSKKPNERWHVFSYYSGDDSYNRQRMSCKRAYW